MEEICRIAFKPMPASLLHHLPNLAPKLHFLWEPSCRLRLPGWKCIETRCVWIWIFSDFQVFLPIDGGLRGEIQARQEIHLLYMYPIHVALKVILHNILSVPVLVKAHPVRSEVELSACVSSQMVSDFWEEYKCPALTRLWNFTRKVVSNCPGLSTGGHSLLPPMRSPLKD